MGIEQGGGCVVRPPETPPAPSFPLTSRQHVIVGLERWLYTVASEKESKDELVWRHLAHVSILSTDI